MRVTLKWQGNEDGALRYLVGTDVQEFRAEVLTQNGPDLPQLVARVQPTSAIPAGLRQAGNEDVVAGRLSSVSIDPAPLANTNLHHTHWILVQCDDAAAAVPVLVVPVWERIAAAVIASLTFFVAIWWAVDLYAAFPHGHGLETVAKLTGLPVVGGISATLAGLFGRRQGELPLWGIYHRLDRAVLAALAVIALVVIGNHELVTIHNESDASIDLKVGTLSAHDRIVVPGPLPELDPRQYTFTLGRASALPDRVLELLEPTAYRVSVTPLPIPLSQLIDPCPEPMTERSANVCNTPSTRPGFLRLRGDALAPGPSLEAPGDHEPLAILFLALPVSSPPIWSSYLQARVWRPSLDDTGARVFFTSVKSGPSLLELSIAAGSARSPVAVTPFPVARHSLDATVDEAANAPVLTETDDAAGVDAQQGGTLRCRGMIDDTVEIVPLDVTRTSPGASMKRLEVTISRPGAPSWSSTFLAHDSGALQAWACRPPASTPERPSYRLTALPGDVVRPWASTIGFDYEVIDAGKGTCLLAKDAELRHFTVTRATGEVSLRDSNGEVISTFRPAKSAPRQDAWLCLPDANKGSMAPLSAVTRPTFGKDSKFVRATAVDGNAITFPPTPALPVEWTF